MSNQLLTQLTQWSREKRFVFEVPKRSQRGDLPGKPRLLLSLCICARAISRQHLGSEILFALLASLRCVARVLRDVHCVQVAVAACALRAVPVKPVRSTA